MDDTKKQLEEITAAIHERMASLDAPVRELLMSDEYIIELRNIVNSHSLNPENTAIVEEITTNFLLGTIRPSDIEQTFVQELSSMTKDSIRSLYNDIKTKILYKVWNIIDSAWKEDDDNEKIFNEVIEMSEVPLPINLQSKGVTTVGEKLQNQLTKNETTEDIKQNTIETKISFEEKINNTNQEQNTAPRETVDRTLPKISLGQGDLYREKPE